MKECYGNYMIDPICQGHNTCEERGCWAKTYMEKGVCSCPYKASCGLGRQKLQERFRGENGQTIEDCDFYIMLKPMYEHRADGV